MDMWGIGCVFFEMLSLYPLFPGENNEIDQIEKIFTVLGMPPKHLMEKWKKLASHINFEFPKRNKIGGKAKSISKMLSHVSIECVDLIEKLLMYDPDERVTPTNARNHPYFKDIREQEIKTRYRQGAP
jgi:renal tumor antigen